MSDDVILRFHVEAYTPETIPMARLAEYLGELAKLLGHEADVHFLKLEAGSTDILHRIEREAAPKAIAQATAASLGKGSNAAIHAFHRLNEMVGSDGGSARLLQEGGAEIIDFPGAKRSLPDYPAVHQRGSIDGVLMRIGGKNDLVPLTLQRGSTDYTGIVASRATAEELGRVLFRHVRLHGDGRWIRTSEGRWLLDRFRVDSFEELGSAPLSSALAGLRAAASGDWALGALVAMDELRHGDAT